ncbi:phenylalanine--tRNA ligase subunit alpha [Metallumcola ferriviriculae]|uniref:Phenylalanine--tRNA ligase alpha subunit n=1 Tax=Metallumcola ferriviriculae TaxID=3039180 RepID=A0AAU0UVC0_9FIRM|nr:phenylalanine--tRNA ligase subunit alpha [Desulfitibacteraceae bacterium MK1]
MREQLEQMRLAAVNELKLIADLEQLEQLRVKYLGKKGELTQVLRGMGKLSPEERPVIGQLANQVKEQLEAALRSKGEDLEKAAQQEKLKAEEIDVTLPGRKFNSGTRHPLYQVLDEIEDIFRNMGFTIAEGSEIELDYYNFEALNIPKDHPARDMQDSFYITEEVLLRTHTSPVQVRTMEKKHPQLPIKIIAPGKVYRRDDDATHSPMFHQVEGLLIDKNVTFGDLKGTLLTFVKRMFGQDRRIRLRPSYFPFTEPSAEMDISCGVCGGSGCRACSNTGWLEILGSGLVHPKVLEMSGYDPQEVTGFAFGIGVERIAMLKYDIDDLRVLFDNDLRFLQQF